MKTTSLFFAALIVLLGSCRKDRTCNCTVTKEGTVTTRNQTPGISINISPLPPVEVVAPSDTTIVSPLNGTYEEKTVYQDIKLKTAKSNCVSNYEVSVSENSVQILPGTATITTTQSGKKIYSCKIE